MYLTLAYIRNLKNVQYGRQASRRVEEISIMGVPKTAKSSIMYIEFISGDSTPAAKNGCLKLRGESRLNIVPPRWASTLAGD